MERQWATLADSATAMLQHAHCPAKYWELAMRTAAYLRNRFPSPAAFGGVGGVPYTLLHGVPTDLAHLKVFGCTAYLRLEDLYMDKLSPKDLRFMFIGYCDDGPGYRLLSLATGKLVRTIHVAFVESQPKYAYPTPSVPYGTSQASPPNGLELGGATKAYLSCVNPTHFTVLTSNPLRSCKTMQRMTTTPMIHQQTLAMLTVILHHA
jgi:hypothetical protein